MLCGSDKGNMAYIRQVAAAAGIEDRVLMPGFVPDEALHVFYKNAVALVMPTFLGPTNIPLLEAAELGCPVICSDLEGHREMMGEAALYFDPADAGEMEQQLRQIKHDPALRMNLIAAARRQMEASGFSIGKSVQVLERILLEAIPVRKTWGFPQCLFPVLAFTLLAA
jgi:glycosyltransferase involved in cell wall biosynthesis